MNAELEEKIGMLSNDKLDDEILRATHKGDPEEKQYLKELLNEKDIRKNDPANSARARVLQKLLDQVGNTNRDHTVRLG